MKHASPPTLDKIEPLLTAVRGNSGIKEKGRAIFYRKGAAFVHFHEDPAGIFADLKVEREWLRFPVNTPADRQAFLERVNAALGTPSKDAAANSGDSQHMKIRTIVMKVDDVRQSPSSGRRS